MWGRNKKKANLLPPRQDSTTEGETLTRVCCVVSAEHPHALCCFNDEKECGEGERVLSNFDTA